MAFQRLALPGCLVAAILVVPTLAAAQPDPVDNPLGYSTSGPGAAARCETVQFVLTPSHGGAILGPAVVERWVETRARDRGGTERRTRTLP